MNSKNSSLLAIITILTFMPFNFCLAGETTISGTASCIMPQLLEIKTTANSLLNTEKTALAQPIAHGASGNYEVQKEEILISSQENIILAKNTSEKQTATVFTVCAK